MWEFETKLEPPFGNHNLQTTKLVQFTAVIKSLCPKNPEFYTPLALNCQNRAVPPSTGGVKESVSHLKLIQEPRGARAHRARLSMPMPISFESLRNGKRGHYERGLFTEGIFEVSRNSKLSRISRKWSDSPLFSTVWGFSGNSRISRFSRKWKFLKRPLFLKKTHFSDPASHLACSPECFCEFLLRIWLGIRQ